MCLPLLQSRSDIRQSFKPFHCQCPVACGNPGLQPGPHENDFTGELIMETGAFRLICVLLPDAIFSGGLNSCSRVNLKEGHETIKSVFRLVWRYLLILNRCRGDQCRYCADRLRCVATRRHTSRTGTVLQTAHLEKRASNRVDISNKCRVFQCTVNWARARPETTLIASGASGSS